MNKWAWCQEYEREARAKGDEKRLRLTRLRFEAWGLREADPDRAYALYDEGWRLARQLGEPWWAMYYSQRKLQIRMFFGGDYRNAIGAAVEGVLEVRKPQYTAYPFRLNVYFHLVAAYLGVDPLGYAAEIRDAIGTLERDIPRNDTDDFLIEQLKQGFALWLNDLESAERSVQRSLQLANECATRSASDHFLIGAYATLCAIDNERADTSALSEHASTGEVISRRAGYQLRLSEFQLWQGLVALGVGDEASAQRLRRSAIARASRMKKIPSSFWFDALCTWALYKQNLSDAFAVRDRQLTMISGRGCLAYECYCQIERCRLLARMGKPMDKALAAARAAAGKLRDPAPRLAELDAIARGHTEPRS
jgi:hypothetical protein